MRIERLVLAVLYAAATLFGQYCHRFKWQDYCFNHPAAPFCNGHNYAVKNPRSAKKDAGANADVLARVNFGALSASPLARTLIADSERDGA